MIQYNDIKVILIVDNNHLIHYKLIAENHVQMHLIILIPFIYIR